MNRPGIPGGSIPAAPTAHNHARLLDSEGNAQGAVERVDSTRGQLADVVREGGFPRADESVAVDAGVVLETFSRPNIDLGRQAIAPRIDGSTHHRREAGIDHGLAANDDEDSGSFRIPAARMPDAIEAPASQSSA